jgi:acyl-CoA dehydrogenase
MAINVTPISGLDPEINALRRRTADFINAEILPNEEILWQTRLGNDLTDDDRKAGRQQSIELRETIKAKVNEAGLWAPHLPKECGGMGLDFLALAYMYEILAYAVGAATLFGIATPNSGNASILVKYGTEEQKRKWLLQHIEGEMESGFSMTERDHAGSDLRSIETEAVRDGDEWVINGYKWFTSNGIGANLFIVMCRANDPSGALGVPARRPRRPVALPLSLQANPHVGAAELKGPYIITGPSPAHWRGCHRPGDAGGGYLPLLPSYPTVSATVGEHGDWIVM